MLLLVQHLARLNTLKQMTKGARSECGCQKSCLALHARVGVGGTGGMCRSSTYFCLTCD